MFFQKFLKGISGLADEDARRILYQTGMLCNWWRKVGSISPPEIQAKLTERNLIWHLNKYGDFDPSTQAPFWEDTPFISVTAGTVERDRRLARNLSRPALLTALEFATNGFTTDGFIFYGYVFTLGKQSIELEEFAEEVRELNIYTRYLPFQPEGEVAAKIHIPSVRLERVEKYACSAAIKVLDQNTLPLAAWVEFNASYQPPERYANVREVI